jgi:hypothetical protein
VRRRLHTPNGQVVLAVVGSLALLLVAAPAALADVTPPPITVPTTTVPSPAPDPSPTPAPTPKPQPNTTSHVSHSQPTSTPRTFTPPASAPRTSSLTPSRRIQKKPVAGTSKRAKPTPKHRPTATTKPKLKPKAAEPAHSPAITLEAETSKTSTGTNWFKIVLLLGAASVLFYASLMVATRDRRLGRAGLVRTPDRSSHGRPGRVGAAVPPRRGRARKEQSRDAKKAAEPSRQAEDLPAALGARVEAAAATAAAESIVDAPEVEAPPRTKQTTAPHIPAGIPAAKPQTARGTAALPVQEAVETLLQTTADAADNEIVETITEETCEIAIWRGYAKARFYARLAAESEGDLELAFAESPPFRFRGNGVPDRTGAADEAYQALVDRLLAKGWELDESGDSWYAGRFRRPLTPA